MKLIVALGKRATGKYSLTLATDFTRIIFDAHNFKARQEITFLNEAFNLVNLRCSFIILVNSPERDS